MFKFVLLRDKWCVEGYVVQMFYGFFSSKEKAENARDEMIRNNEYVNHDMKKEEFSICEWKEDRQFFQP